VCHLFLPPSVQFRHNDPSTSVEKRANIARSAEDVASEPKNRTRERRSGLRFALAHNALDAWHTNKGL
jgi:hypothetical protein